METERSTMDVYIEKLLAGERVSIEALFCTPTLVEVTTTQHASTPNTSAAPEKVWH